MNKTRNDTIVSFLVIYALKVALNLLNVRGGGGGGVGGWEAIAVDIEPLLSSQDSDCLHIRSTC